MVSGSRSTRPVECDTSIDPPNGDKLACRFGRTSKKILYHVGTAKFPRDSMLQLYEAVLGETNSNLLLVRDVNGPYCFGFQEKLYSVEHA